MVSIASVALLLPREPPAAAERLRSDPPARLRSLDPGAKRRVTDGRVVEVRRGSRELTVRTSLGTIERIVVPATSSIHAPHGSSALSGIHAGMAVHAEGEVDARRRLVARALSAR